MKRPTFALLPLDDRPPNLQFPRRLAAIGRIIVRLPPKRMLGRFLRPGDPEALWEWLQQAAAQADAAVVACDMLAYGGLIASRTTQVPPEVAASRLGRLWELKRRSPRLRLYAFAVIPRLGLTVSSPALAELGPALARYQELQARRDAPACGATCPPAAGELDGRENEDLRRLSAMLPPELVAEHAAMRRRNLAANKGLEALAAQGALDFVVFAQEDAAPSGPHIPEQAELAAEARSLGVSHLVRICPGADETGIALLARAANEQAGLTPAVYPIYATPGGAESVALFEDRPLCMTVAGQIEAAGLCVAPVEGDADIVLGLHSPPAAAQADINQVAQVSNLRSIPRPPFVAHLAELAQTGGDVALADVAYCNGADPALIAALAAEQALPHLAGFAAWNTAGNTIGSALAQAALRRIGRQAANRQGIRGAHAAARAQCEFLFERLLDDYGYQSVVRRQAYLFARESLGEWPLNLRRGRSSALDYVRQQLEPLGRRLFAEHFAGVELEGRRIAQLREVRISLPWPRLFEVQVEAAVGLT